MNEELLRAEWAAAIASAIAEFENALASRTDVERDNYLESAEDCLTTAGKMHMRLVEMGAWQGIAQQVA